MKRNWNTSRIFLEKNGKQKETWNNTSSNCNFYLSTNFYSSLIQTRKYPKDRNITLCTNMKWIWRLEINAASGQTAKCPKKPQYLAINRLLPDSFISSIFSRKALSLYNWIGSQHRRTLWSCSFFVSPSWTSARADRRETFETEP